MTYLVVVVVVDIAVVDYHIEKPYHEKPYHMRLKAAASDIVEGLVVVVVVDIAVVDYPIEKSYHEWLQAAGCYIVMNFVVVVALVVVDYYPTELPCVLYVDHTLPFCNKDMYMYYKLSHALRSH